MSRISLLPSSTQKTNAIVFESEGINMGINVGKVLFTNQYIALSL